MEITKEWLRKKGACPEGIDWFIAQPETDAESIVEKLLKEKEYEWVNWLIVRLMSHKQQIEYAIFAAEQVVEIYAAEYPEDKRPQAAIAAAKECLKNPTYAAYAAAADATYAAAHATHAAADATHAAADATYAAAHAAAADAAADAADAAAHAADAAAHATHAAAHATYAADAAAYADAATHADADAAAAASKDKMYRKILDYGLSLIKESRTSECGDEIS